ncbi:hypothetical protein OESDEN_11604 [Oesophagostomum dentatum]|uniref:Major facilitator superfamily (MFS) profile domain-containing protein n=1 Tax=Oesophagostomum dentatum TaxID=61180 RepID=A0A0B1SXH0_OESDE|nr:hypothetical protein OESDEN_11604 [Oesophagostomum dentatum]
MSGQLVSAQALCFTVSKLVFGVAADRTSPLRILSFGLAVVSLSSACFGIVSSFYQILFAAACIGGLQGASWVPATKLLAKWYTDRSYGKMFSVLGCGSTAAGLLIPLVTALYWRKFMTCSGVVMVVYSLFLFFALRNDDVKPPSPSGAEKSSRLASLTYSPIRTVCESWIPLYITENGISLATFQVLYEVGGVFGNIGSGALLDYLSIRISVNAARRIIGLGSTTLLLIVAAFSIRYMVRTCSVFM